MASIIQQKRFANELKMIGSEPLHYITAYPDDKDPLTWYFLIRGQKDTSFHGGDFIGKIIHSKKYPAEPPSYFMLTPSGRYEVNKEICLTNSRYHKGEWSSTWNIKTILIAFYSIFLDDSTTGISHIHKSDAERKVLAKGAIEYNTKYHNDIYIKFNFTNLSDNAPVVKPISKQKEEVKEVKEVKPDVMPDVKEVVKEEVKPEVVENKPEVVENKPEVVENKPEIVEIIENLILSKEENIKKEYKIIIDNATDFVQVNKLSDKIKDINNKLEEQFNHIKNLEKELKL